MLFSELQAAWLARAEELGYSLIHGDPVEFAPATDPDLPSETADAVLRILEDANIEGSSLAYKPLRLLPDQKSVQCISSPLPGVARGTLAVLNDTLLWTEITGQPGLADDPK